MYACFADMPRIAAQPERSSANPIAAIAIAERRPMTLILNSSFDASEARCAPTLTRSGHTSPSAVLARPGVIRVAVANLPRYFLYRNRDGIFQPEALLSTNSRFSRRSEP